MKYDFIVFMCSYDKIETIKDTVENIFDFNENVCVIINYAGDEDYSTVESDKVHFVKRKQNIDKFDTLIPLHIDLMDYVTENNITSDYILLLASNQMFVKKGLYEYMKPFDASYFNRGVTGHVWVTKPIFKKYFNDLGQDSFTYQSNHDGMFFKYNIFKEMMLYFDDFRDKIVSHHNEEYLYPAYLMKNVPKDKLTVFGNYNYWPQDITIPEISWFEFYYMALKQKKFFFVKKIPKDINSAIRKFIKTLNQ